ncbi:helix-turn-helix transcriptional regulator [Acidisphaera sp. S103]|uniref:helix-turn-helix domain-containing protein n=1 Tax=Acidisphaera sp. S103 TaxID=1747223 RepID=UPI001C2066C4|nr:helix-turn-helix transcriptional regulator [Acidisphaera sp. S103]
MGRQLRRFRRLRGIKQDHVAALLGVSQGLISRWEAGLHTPSPALYRRLEKLLASKVDPAADAALRRLIENAVAPVHLICDASHVLLAASAAREAEWGSRATPFLGTSLWRFATSEIVASEERLPDRGWFEETDPGMVLVETGGNGSRDMRILPSTLAWERIALADGRIGRLVTTIAFA